MAKVDWINWKTDTKEIINPKSIEEKINELFTNYNTYMNPVIYEEIKHEANKGGLTKESFNVMGDSHANDMANEILNKIDEIKQIMGALKSDIVNLAEEQKQIEKEQLIFEIEKKIKREETVRENALNSEEFKSQILEMGENPEDIISIVNDRIEKLIERLDIANSL